MSLEDASSSLASGSLSGEIEMGEGAEELLMKFVFVGQKGGGKTAIIDRFVHHRFGGTKTTIGVDYHLRKLEINKQAVQLQLWDVGGEERFGCMTRLYYKKAVGAVLVMDGSNPKAFEGARQWKVDLDTKSRTKSDAPIPCILLVNKSDCESCFEDSQLAAFARQIGCVGWGRTSAKTGEGVKQHLMGLVRYILKKGIRPYVPELGTPVVSVDRRTLPQDSLSAAAPPAAASSEGPRAGRRFPFSLLPASWCAT